MKKGPAKKKAAPTPTPTPKRKYNRKKAAVIDNKRTAVPPQRVVVSDAEATIKHAIFDGIIDQWHKKDEPNFAVIVRDKVFERLFLPPFRWAVEEHLESLK